MGVAEAGEAAIHEDAGGIEAAGATGTRQDDGVGQDAGAAGHALAAGVGTGGGERDGHAIFDAAAVADAVLRFAGEVLIHKKAGLHGVCVVEGAVEGVAGGIGGADAGEVAEALDVDFVDRQAVGAGAPFVIVGGNPDHNRTIAELIVAVIVRHGVVVALQRGEAGRQRARVHAYAKADLAGGADVVDAAGGVVADDDAGGEKDGLAVFAGNAAQVEVAHGVSP